MTIIEIIITIIKLELNVQRLIEHIYTYIDDEIRKQIQRGKKEKMRTQNE